MSLTRWFPNLSPTNHRETSPATPAYNCVAWAAGDSSAWWEPVVGHWPDGVPTRADVASYAALFVSLGYEPCTRDAVTPEWECVAIYGDDGWNFTHVARLGSNGRWTSKLGALQDIEHENLEALEGGDYGTVRLLLRRPRSSSG